MKLLQFTLQPHLPARPRPGIGLAVSGVPAPRFRLAGLPQPLETLYHHGIIILMKRLQAAVDSLWITL